MVKLQKDFRKILTINDVLKLFTNYQLLFNFTRQ